MQVHSFQAKRACGLCLPPCAGRLLAALPKYLNFPFRGSNDAVLMELIVITIFTVILIMVRHSENNV